MFKGLTNLIIVLIIAFIASGISVTLCPTVDSVPSETAESSLSQISILTDLDSNSLYNPKNISLKFTSNKNTKLSLTSDHIIKANIYKNNNLFKTKNFNRANNQSSISITKNVPYIMNLDLSQENLNIPNGEYKIIIDANVKEKHLAPLTLTLKYMGNQKYIPASNKIPDGKMPLTLYFPDKDNKIDELIGVTRFVKYSNKPLNTTIKELQKGPDNSTGLNSSSPIGNVNYITIKKGITYVNLPSDEKIYTESSTRSNIAMESFLKSLSSISGIDHIKFLVDNQRKKLFFNGNDISSNIKLNKNNKVYLSFNNYKRYFLVGYNVYEINNNFSITEKVDKMIDKLKKSTDNLSNTIPNNVEIKNFSVSDGILKLNFNKNLVNSYDGNKNLQRMMVDSILFSFTSIEGVNRVHILVDNDIVSEFAGLDISKPLERPKFINPEV
ncbi:GerMN domain-containing protein [Dethiothermospora halolimnae]|uniref:GerMN domain-containing protein n=1 Tax=Dethiothermospora halolimnae TaxID=3114390 RepID=UPI003CCBF8F8